jgi:hypothetical protein
MNNCNVIRCSNLAQAFLNWLEFLLTVNLLYRTHLSTSGGQQEFLLRCVSTITFLQETCRQTRSQCCLSKFVANKFGLPQASYWQTRRKYGTFVCDVTRWASLWASLSASLFLKCDSGNAPLGGICQNTADKCRSQMTFEVWGRHKMRLHYLARRSIESR